MNVQRKIVGDIIEVLKKKGFRSIEVYNEIGLLLEAWKDETG
jgi:nucleoside diphosphate kinase